MFLTNIITFPGNKSVHSHIHFVPRFDVLSFVFGVYRYWGLQFRVLILFSRVFLFGVQNDFVWWRNEL
mgnify:CR=1 FL=1